MTHANDANAVVFPWSDTRVFAENLRSGQLSLPTAISQISAVSRETLKALEEISSEYIKSSTEAKTKVEKMDKLISDLTDKCQALQQALLYKEEKYDEKCREVERYKVICELSAKAAVSDDLCYTEKVPKLGSLYEQPIRDLPGGEMLMQDQQVVRQSDTQSEYKRNFKSHVKLNQEQKHMSNYIDALKSPTNSQMSEMTTNSTAQDAYVRQNRMASYYVGGPCKRKPSVLDEDTKFRGRLASIGGINVGTSESKKGPVPINKLLSSDLSNQQRSQEFHRPLYDDVNRTCKIALANQSNEIMSSSKNVANQMMQKFTERDLHRQVASGCYTRLSSRRKKEWPF